MSLTKVELAQRIDELAEENEELQDRLDQIAGLSVPQAEDEDEGETCGDDEYDSAEALVGD